MKSKKLERQDDNNESIQKIDKRNIDINNNLDSTMSLNKSLRDNYNKESQKFHDMKDN